MKRKRHTPEQIIRKLRTAVQLLNQGQTVADVCRALEVSPPTYHRWHSCTAGCRRSRAEPISHRGQTTQGTGAGKRPSQAPSCGCRAGQSNALAAGPAKP